MFASYNSFVIRIARAAALLLIAPFLTFASALAPQHIHEPGPGHDHAVVHSHFAPHEMAPYSTDTEIEHDIEHVVWVDAAILHQPIHKATHVPPALSVCDDEPHATRGWSVVRANHAPPPHGPPRNLNRFRGPPPSSELI
jgi:hypothetical protein